MNQPTNNTTTGCQMLVMSFNRGSTFSTPLSFLFFSVQTLSFSLSLSLSVLYHEKNAVGPMIVPFEFPKSIQQGMRARLLCSIMQGDPPFTFSWFKDGRKLDPSTLSLGLRSDDYSTDLTFHRLTTKHNGNYSCLVKNDVASISHSATLFLDGSYPLSLSLSLFCFHTLYHSCSSLPSVFYSLSPTHSNFSSHHTLPFLIPSCLCSNHQHLTSFNMLRKDPETTFLSFPSSLHLNIFPV